MNLPEAVSYLHSQLWAVTRLEHHLVIISSILCGSKIRGTILKNGFFQFFFPSLHLFGVKLLQTITLIYEPPRHPTHHVSPHTLLSRDSGCIGCLLKFGRLGPFDSLLPVIWFAYQQIKKMSGAILTNV